MEYSYFSLVKFTDNTQTPASSALETSKYNKYAFFGDEYNASDIERYKQYYESLNILTSDYYLNIVNGANPCLNTGSEFYLTDDDKNINITQDADGYARIQDCTVDIGAYESANEENIAYETA